MAKSVLERVLDLVHDVTGQPVTGCDRTTDLRDDLGADSLDIVELELAVEDEFGLQPPEGDHDEPPGDDWETVGDVVAWVEARIH